MSEDQPRYGEDEIDAKVRAECDRLVRLLHDLADHHRGSRLDRRRDRAVGADGRASARGTPVASSRLPLATADRTQRAPFTDLQGQYLAFIYAYEKIHRQPPAEADMQRFFNVTPPSVHRMVVELERRGLIGRTPGKARSLTLLVRPENLPILR